MFTKANPTLRKCALSSTGNQDIPRYLMLDWWNLNCAKHQHQCQTLVHITCEYAENLSCLYNVIITHKKHGSFAQILRVGSVVFIEWRLSANDMCRFEGLGPTVEAEATLPMPAASQKDIGVTGPQSFPVFDTYSSNQEHNSANYLQFLCSLLRKIWGGTAL